MGRTTSRAIGCLKPKVAMLAAVLGVFAASQPNAWAETSGKQDFLENCAACHGDNGKGGGKDLYFLPSGVKPPDLTRLSKNNGGLFPTEEVYQSIDGRGGMPSHERFNMPFWGTKFQPEGQEFTPESNAKVKARISAIVGYVETLQEK